MNSIQVEEILKKLFQIILDFDPEFIEIAVYHVGKGYISNIDSINRFKKLKTEIKQLLDEWEQIKSNPPIDYM